MFLSTLCAPTGTATGEDYINQLVFETELLSSAHPSSDGVMANAS